jgi:hypothetical protein
MTQEPKLIGSPQAVQAMNRGLADLALAMGVSAEDVGEFVAQWSILTEALTESPKKELLFRCNAWRQGDDPGEPVNWRGERGLLP